LSAIGTANAVENPFGINEIQGGFVVADTAEGKCGEGKCGENKSAKEGNSLDRVC